VFSIIRGKRNANSYLFIFIIVFICIITFSTYSKNNNADDKTEYNELMALDLDKTYLVKPEDVVEVYYKAVSSLYNNNLSEEEIEDVIKIERMLFSKELLEINPYDAQLEAVKNSIGDFKKAKKSVVGFEEISVAYDEVSQKICKVETAFILTGQSINFIHTLILEEGNWKILSWEEKAED
jgi:hypothetical protein